MENYLRKWIRIVEGNDDSDHADALQKTGFWGAQAGGCLFLARDTKRFLIAHRSRYVEQPGTYGTWGGAIDKGEDPLEAVKREVVEETGFTGSITVEPLYVFKKDTFRYYNFLFIIDEEFEPRLDWESQGYVWTEFGKWPSPLHFGLISLLKDRKSIAIMKKYSTQK